eukprot:2117332-Pleurochrysis_carterae.AAC.1
MRSVDACAAGAAIPADGPLTLARVRACCLAWTAQIRQTYVTTAQAQDADESESSVAPRDECACTREQRGRVDVRGAMARHN